MDIVTDLSSLSDSEAADNVKRDAYRMHFCLRFSENAPKAWESLLALEPIALEAIDFGFRTLGPAEFMKSYGEVPQPLQVSVAEWAAANHLQTDNRWFERVAALTVMRQALGPLLGTSRPESISPHPLYDKQDYSLFAPVQITHPAVLLTWRRDKATWVEFRNRVVNEFIHTLESSVMEKLGPDFDSITPKKQFGERDLRAIDLFTRKHVNGESQQTLSGRFYGLGDHRKEVRRDIASTFQLLGIVMPT